VLLCCVTTVVIIVNLCYVCWLYYFNHTITVRFTVYFSELSTLYWQAILRLFLSHLALPDEYNAGLSNA
ncbi:hypothetical protein NE451_21710, partial [Bacteroides nordii]|uniref:hypothetical protein n=1 Tax=Bacteroides nordii TaxID=291645 RepID=UPI00210DDB47